MSGQGEKNKTKKRSDSQNRLEGGKPRYSQHESGSSGDQLEEQGSAGMIPAEDRGTASLGGSQAQGTGDPVTASTCPCPLQKEQKCKWGRERLS